MRQKFDFSGNRMCLGFIVALLLIYLHIIGHLPYGVLIAICFLVGMIAGGRDEHSRN